MSRRTTTIGLGVLAVLFMVLITSRIGDGGYATSGDAHYIYATARSMAFDADLDLGNQLRAMGDRWGYGNDPAADGWRLPPRELGPSVLMVPGLWLHRLSGLSARWAPTFAVLLSCLSLAALFPICLRILEALGLAPERASQLALVATLGLVVPYYAIGRAGYAHAPDAVVCAGLTLAIVRERGPATVGLLLALAVLFRLQNLLWLAWPLAIAFRRGGARALARVAAVGALGLLGLLPQAWLALAHPGSELGAVRWGRAFFDLDGYPTDLLLVLFGSHGLFSWTPLAALAVAGLIVAARQKRAPGTSPALWVLGLQLLLLASVRDPSGGWAFGARRLAGCTGIFCAGLGLAAQNEIAQRHPRAFWSVIWTLVALNLLLTALALSGRISLAP